MRLRSIQNPNTGAEQIAEYFDRTIYSTCVLSTSFQSYDFFQNIEAAALRNYQTSSNFFLSQQGAVIALQMSLHGVNYAALNQITTTTYGDRMDAWNKLLQQGQLTVTLDTKPNAILLGSDLAISPPILVESSGAGVLNDVNPHFPVAQPTGLYNRPSAQAGQWYDPLLLVANNRTLQHTFQTPAAVDTTALDRFAFKMTAVIEEYPSLNPAPVRT